MDNILDTPCMEFWRYFSECLLCYAYFPLAGFLLSEFCLYFLRGVFGRSYLPSFSAELWLVFFTLTAACHFWAFYLSRGFHVDPCALLVESHLRHLLAVEVCKIEGEGKRKIEVDKFENVKIGGEKVENGNKEAEKLENGKKEVRGKNGVAKISSKNSKNNKKNVEKIILTRKSTKTRLLKQVRKCFPLLQNIDCPNYVQKFSRKLLMAYLGAWVCGTLLRRCDPNSRLFPQTAWQKDIQKIQGGSFICGTGIFRLLHDSYESSPTTSGLFLKPPNSLPAPFSDSLFYPLVFSVVTQKNAEKYVQKNAKESQMYTKWVSRNRQFFEKEYAKIISEKKRIMECENLPRGDSMCERDFYTSLKSEGICFDIFPCEQKIVLEGVERGSENTCVLNSLFGSDYYARFITPSNLAVGCVYLETVLYEFLLTFCLCLYFAQAALLEGESGQQGEKVGENMENEEKIESKNMKNFEQKKNFEKKKNYEKMKNYEEMKNCEEVKNEEMGEEMGQKLVEKMGFFAAKNPPPQSRPNLLTTTGIATNIGIIVMGILTPSGYLFSGPHLNPCYTILLAVYKNFGLPHALFVSSLQLLAAILAAQWVLPSLT